MALTYNELMALQPDLLDSASNTVDRARKQLVDQQSEMTAGKPPAEWEGDSAVRASGRYRVLVDDVDDLAAPQAALVVGIDDAASRIRSAQQRAKHAHDAVQAKHWIITYTGNKVEVSDPTPRTKPSKDDPMGPAAGSADDERKMSEYADIISSALTDGDEAVQDLDAVLRKVTSGGYDGGTGSIKDAVPPDIAALLGAGEKGHVAPDKTAMKHFREFITPYQHDPAKMRRFMNQIGEQGIAGALHNGAATGVDIKGALGSTGRDVCEGWVEHDIKTEGVGNSTNRIMDAYGHDKPFARQLFTHVTPDDFAKAIEHESKQAFPDGVLKSATDRGIYSGFLHAAGTTLATYTGTLNAHDANALAGEWAHKIKGSDHGEASALSLMVKYGGEKSAYNDHFIYNLANETYDYDHKHGASVWGDGGGLIDPDAATSKTAPGLGAPVPHGASAKDCLDNVLGGLNRSPGAAQHFFNNGYDSSSDTHNSRLDYLLLHRHSGDKGDGLGLALEGATVRAGVDGDGHHSAFSNRLTTELFNTIAHHSSDGHSTWSGGWHVPENMRDNLGTIAAGYSSDVYDAFTPGVGGRGGELMVSTDNMHTVLGELGHGADKTGLQTLTAGLAAEGQHRADAEVQAFREGRISLGDFTTAITDHNTATGNVLGTALGYSGVLDEADHNRAALQASYIQKAFDVAGGFIPGGSGVGDEIGGVGGHLVGSAIDVGSSQGLDALKNSVAGNPVDPGSSVPPDSVKDMMQHNTINNFLKAGLIDPKSIPPQFLTHDSDGRPILLPGVYGSDDLAHRHGLTSGSDATDWNSMMTRTDGNFGKAQEAWEPGASSFDNSYGDYKGKASNDAGKDS